MRRLNCSPEDKGQSKTSAAHSPVMLTLGRNHMPANNAPVFNSVQSTGTQELNKQMYDNSGSSTTKQEH